MIEHVVAATVHDAGFDDRVIQTRLAHDLFRRPLRLVIHRTTVRSRTQKTHKYDLLDTRAPRSFDDVARGCDVNTRESLLAECAVDARAVRHCVTTTECVDQGVDIVKRR